MKGYKVFRPDWTCRGFQYEAGGVYKMDTEPIICERGFHFCENLNDCFTYYPFNSANKVAVVEASGSIVSDDDGKSCTNEIAIVKELSWEEVLQLVNTGKACTGRGNSGDRNSGNWNSGNCNSGDWNSTFGSSGCFNTEEAKILMFNKPSGWTLKDWYGSRARHLLNQIPKDVVEWIWSDDMTDDEKSAHPEHKTTGGYLKILEEAENAQNWWSGLSESDRNVIRSIPNFDPAIFKQCTGIDVNK